MKATVNGKRFVEAGILGTSLFGALVDVEEYVSSDGKDGTLYDLIHLADRNLAHWLRSAQR